MSGIGRVGVIGAGLMGSGIAQTAAVAGHDTIVCDTHDEPLARARAAIERSLGKFVEKGTLSPAARDAALARISFATRIEALADAELVIEAVTEDLEVKNRLWQGLDGICPPEVLFASNTSSLTITSMATVTGRADRFVGLHFFNPVPLMPLVEVVRALTTSATTLGRAVEFVRGLGKEPVVTRDTSGFIVNRLLVPFLLDAVRALESGVATMSDIDRAMKLGAGHPMGPFTLLDLVGNDTTCRIAEIMFQEYREPRYAPPPLLRRMVTAGLHGRKTGKGFYDYSSDPPVPADLGM